MRLFFQTPKSGYHHRASMRVFYTPRYYADIGEGHIFPIRKFELVRARILQEGIFKLRSTLDIALPDGTPDKSYLHALADSLPSVFRHDPEIVFYLGGADPYVGDKLGRLAVSIAGLSRRDELVLRKCYEREIPVVTVMSGGYGEDISDTVEIHCNTVRAARRIFDDREDLPGQNPLQMETNEKSAG